ANINAADGQVSLADPTLGQFFNTGAFLAPPAGQFGDSLRNMIIGPSTHQLNAQLVRDLRLGGNRALTLQVNAIKVLNTAEWSAINTLVGSAAFGQVTSFRPPRSVTLNARFRF